MPRVHHIKKAQKNNKAAGTKNGPGLLVGRVKARQEQLQAFLEVPPRRRRERVHLQLAVDLGGVFPTVLLLYDLTHLHVTKGKDTYDSSIDANSDTEVTTWAAPVVSRVDFGRGRKCAPRR